MPQLKTTAALISEILMGLRESQETETLPFVFGWTKEDTLEIVVEEKGGLFKHEAKINVKYTKDIRSRDYASLTSITLMDLHAIDPRTRIPFVYPAGTVIGSGSFDQSGSTEEGYFSIRDSIEDALKFLVENRG